MSDSVATPAHTPAKTRPDADNYTAFPPAPPRLRVDIEALRHPTEHSRLVLALCASVVPLVLGVLLAALLVPLLVAVWVFVQMHHARLLGNSVRVTAETLPEVHSVVEDVCARLDYQEGFDVYAANETSPKISLTSYLGTKILLIDGDFIGGLVRAGDRAQLTFIIAQRIGALKARHTRLTVVAVIINAFSRLRVLNLGLLPYYRATTYSSDRIAQTCCGSMNGALAAIEQQMMGRDIRPTTAGRGGIIAQADVQRTRLLSRFAQLLQPSPHLTNRYLSLLSYNRDANPAAWQEFRGRLDDAGRARLDLLTTN